MISANLTLPRILYVLKIMFDFITIFNVLQVEVYFDCTVHALTNLFLEIMCIDVLHWSCDHKAYGGQVSCTHA